MDRKIDNKYRLLRELGQGGMGSVYEAEHIGVGRRVAVKLLHKTVVDADPKNLGRLQREARLAGTLESPHIAQVSDVGVDSASGSPYLVLEYLEGMDLDQVLRVRGRLPLSLSLRIAAQTCVGLRRAHEAGIIHRDIKPANLFLSQRDEDIVVKILDFGIAKPAADQLANMEQAALTRTGTLIGSPLYMSPEQARGLKTIDQRADLWSLGVVLFNMLAGQTPNHEVDALGELILVICSTVSPSVRDYEPSVPMNVAEMVQRALAILPEHRFANAAEMYDALIGALDTSAKGSARHHIDITELPTVASAARASRESHKSRETFPSSLSGSSPPSALERTELHDSGADLSPGVMKTAISATNLSDSAAQRKTEPAPIPAKTAALEVPSGTTDNPAAPNHAASVEAVVHSPVPAAPPARGRALLWGGAAALGAGLAIAYGVFGTGGNGRASGTNTPTTSPMSSTVATTDAPTASAEVPSVSPADSAATADSAAIPSASASAEPLPPQPTTTTPVATTPMVTTTATTHLGPRPTATTTATHTAAPADTTTFGGRK